jgi:uncharacterized protein (TIGR03503 family)
VRRLLSSFLLSVSVFLTSVWAAQSELEQATSKTVVAIENQKSTQNIIQLLQNRFRIDYKVEQATLIFFRDYGSPPVILVQPDGSKIYQTDSITEPGLEWFDELSYDMIKITAPMAGPWQVLGSVLPNSRVMVLSDLELLVEPMPTILFAGEILKQTVTLSNGGETIEQNEFRDVVDLDIRFISTNNESAQNFALPSVSITQFVDKGQGMDERPNDGVFTGKMNLDIAAGEWTPEFTVQTPMFSRVYQHDTVNLLPTPVAFTADLDTSLDGSGRHTINIYAESPFIDPQDFVISGGVQAPNGDVQKFTLSESTEAGVRRFSVPNYLAGIYRVNVTLYGTTIDDREIVVTVPEYSFIAAPQPSITPVEVVEEIEPNLLSAKVDVTSLQTEVEGAQPDKPFPWMILILVNLCVILTGGALFAWFKLKA